MSIILQNTLTRRFVATSPTTLVNWSHNQRFAVAFGSGVEAFDYCRHNQLSDMHIVLTFGKADYQVEVPVRNRR